MELDILMYAEMDNYKEWNPFDGNVIRMFEANEFHPEITSIPYPNVYYHGYWINKNWFGSYKDILLKELSFPELPSASAKVYADQIMTTPSVAVHVRRGDYVDLGWQLSQDYYAKAMYDMSQKVNGFTVFVFSDDLQWCQEHAKDLGFDYASKVVYVEGNTGQNSYVDMQLMSMCEGMVLSNCAFCYLAALMNQRLKFYKNPTKREL